MCNSLFKTPNEWIRDNVAGFLLFCSENIILYYIGGMIETEEELEVKKAAILVSDMIIMSNRFENEFTCKKGMGRLLDRQVLIRIFFHCMSTYTWVKYSLDDSFFMG